MDTFTQAALGATVAQAAFGKRLGPKAALAGALIGALPDLDIVSAAWGPWASLVHHRGITHSLLFAPVVAPLLGYVAWRIAKRRDHWWRWSHLAFWALVTHPLLDLFTSYGTQLLAPLSDRRFAIDAVPIVDPIYSLLLIGALVVGWLWRSKARVRVYAATTALILSTGYLLWGFAESRTAQQLAASQLRAGGFEPVHVRAQPSLFIWMWRVVARDERGNLRIGAVSTYRPTPMDFVAVERPDDPIVDRALASERGRIFEWFADGMVGVRIERHPDKTRVYLDDQRYGLVTDPAEAFWGAHADFDASGRLIAVDRYRNDPGGKMTQALAASWRFMWDGVPAPASRAQPSEPESATEPEAAVPTGSDHAG